MNGLEFIVGSNGVDEVTAPPATSQARGGGPDGGPVAFRIGFASEPVVALAAPDASVLYSECLARVASTDGVVHGAGCFVEYLELVRAIDLLDVAMVQMVTRHLADHPGLRLGCNLSALTVGNDAAWSRILDAISAKNDVASRLTIEVTETQALNPLGRTGDHLAAARSLGCRLAIDDFGVGFSQQAYLQEAGIEWDIIKIDRSCFKGALIDEAARKSLRSTVRLASSFAGTVVVEGIETQLHLELAREAGAEYGQGWLFPFASAKNWSSLSGALHHYIARALDPSKDLVVAAWPVSSAGHNRIFDEGLLPLAAEPDQSSLRFLQCRGKSA